MNSTNKPFRYIWDHSPIDWWYGAQIAGPEETARVLADMPENSRDDIVFKTFMPDDCEFVPVYFCKASNNGTVYIFSDYDVHDDHKRDDCFTYGDWGEIRRCIR